MTGEHLLSLHTTRDITTLLSLFLTCKAETVLWLDTLGDRTARQVIFVTILTPNIATFGMLRRFRSRFGLGNDYRIACDRWSHIGDGHRSQGNREYTFALHAMVEIPRFKR